MSQGKYVLTALRDAQARIDTLERQLGYKQTRVDELKGELLALKGPCSNSRCPLHYAHSGPCEPQTNVARVNVA